MLLPRWWLEEKGKYFMAMLDYRLLLYYSNVQVIAEVSGYGIPIID